MPAPSQPVLRGITGDIFRKFSYALPVACYFCKFYMKTTCLEKGTEKKNPCLCPTGGLQVLYGVKGTPDLGWSSVMPAVC